MANRILFENKQEKKKKKKPGSNLLFPVKWNYIKSGTVQVELSSYPSPAFD